MSNTTDAWIPWQQQISRYLDEHGLLPTPTTEGLDIPLDVASECWMVADTSPGELASLCRLTDAMGAADERAAVLLFLSYLSNDAPYLRLQEPEESESRAAIRKLYCDAVSLLPVDEIDTAWRIRWELPFAASAGLWDRTRALVGQWSALAPSEEHDALTALARINFLSVHPSRWTGSDWSSDWWSSYEGSQYSRIGDLFPPLFAARLDDRADLDSAPWSLPRTMSADEFARVLDAENAIAKLQDAGGGGAMLRLVGAWCSAAAAVRLQSAERTRDAARRYALLARDPDLPEPLHGADGKARRLLAWSATMLFRAVPDLGSARDMTAFWTQVDPESPDGWKFRAEVERQMGIEGWADSYERYIQLSPEADTSWERSELLRLLLESRDQTAADRALRTLASEHADRPVVEEMLTWDWAAYSHLNESTRERWWHGLVFVCDARVRKAFRETPWRYAAACFGEAVALELRARVIGPLLTIEGVERQPLAARDAKIAKALLSSKATLGAMVEALNLTRDAQSELGKVIARFLDRRHRPLRSHFRSRLAAERLRAATEFRNEAVHGGDITPGEARQVYDEARAFLDILVKEDPRIATP